MDFIDPLPTDEGYSCILTTNDCSGSDIWIILTKTTITTEDLSDIFWHLVLQKRITKWHCLWPWQNLCILFLESIDKAHWSQTQDVKFLSSRNRWLIGSNRRHHAYVGWVWGWMGEGWGEHMWVCGWSGGGYTHHSPRCRVWTHMICVSHSQPPHCNWARMWAPHAWALGACVSPPHACLRVPTCLSCYHLVQGPWACILLPSLFQLHCCLVWAPVLRVWALLARICFSWLSIPRRSHSSRW